MLTDNYVVADQEVWHGRTDSEENFDAFRWHQWVQFIDLNDETLAPFTGELGFCFIGFCSDLGIRANKGRGGAANAPASIRKELSNLPCWFDSKVRLFDAGDVKSENHTLEECQHALDLVVDRVLALNLFPIVLGGGHEVAFGHYKGILRHLKQSEDKPNIGIINFDAHFDMRPYDKGASSGTMFRQIADLCTEQSLDYSYMCVGVQKYSNTVDLFKIAEEKGVTYVLEKDISSDKGWGMTEKFDKFVAHRDHIYITICADVFSSAYAPGVSATQPLGLTPNAVLRFIKYILKSKKVVSFDIAEVSPRFDQDNTTATLAKVLIFSVVNTLCEIHNLSIE